MSKGAWVREVLETALDQETSGADPLARLAALVTKIRSENTRAGAKTVLLFAGLGYWFGATMAG